MTSFGDQTLGVCLTARELEVLELVASGLSAKEIALRVSICPRTVERHIDNARLKMRARNRTHLVTCAIASGLLDTQAPDRHGDQFPLPLAHGRPADLEAVLLL